MECLNPRILIHRNQKVKNMDPQMSTTTKNGSPMVLFVCFPSVLSTGAPPRSTSPIRIFPYAMSKNRTLKIILFAVARIVGFFSSTVAGAASSAASSCARTGDDMTSKDRNKLTIRIENSARDNLINPPLKNKMLWQVRIGPEFVESRPQSQSVV